MPRKQRNTDRRILVVTSDWHAGHRLGLMNPETVLYEQRIDGKGMGGGSLEGSMQWDKVPADIRKALEQIDAFTKAEID